MKDTEQRKRERDRSWRDRDIDLEKGLLQGAWAVAKRYKQFRNTHVSTVELYQKNPHFGIYDYPNYLEN